MDLNDNDLLSLELTARAAMPSLRDEMMLRVIAQLREVTAERDDLDDDCTELNKRLDLAVSEIDSLEEDRCTCFRQERS